MKTILLLSTFIVGLTAHSAQAALDVRSITFQQSIQPVSTSQPIYLQNGRIFFDRNGVNTNAAYCLFRGSEDHPISAGATFNIQSSREIMFGVFRDSPNQNLRHKGKFKIDYWVNPKSQFDFVADPTFLSAMVCLNAVQQFPFTVPLEWITDFPNHQREYQEELSRQAELARPHVIYLTEPEVESIARGIFTLEVNTNEE